MLETTKNLLDNIIDKSQYYPLEIHPEELYTIVEDIVKIEREDAFRRGKDYVYATAVELLSRESVNKLLGDM